MSASLESPNLTLIPMRHVSRSLDNRISYSTTRQIIQGGVQIKWGFDLIQKKDIEIAVKYGLVLPTMGGSIKQYNTRKAAYEEVKSAFLKEGIDPPKEQVKCTNTYTFKGKEKIILANYDNLGWRLEYILPSIWLTSLDKKFKETFSSMTFSTRSEAVDALKWFLSQNPYFKC